MFASAYGLQNIGYIAVIDLGHEIFIWFVFLALLLILPPPFIVPLFMGQDSISDGWYVNNVLTLHTVVTIVVFAIFFILNPSI